RVLVLIPIHPQRETLGRAEVVVNPSAPVDLVGVADEEAGDRRLDERSPLLTHALVTGEEERLVPYQWSADLCSPLGSLVGDLERREWWLGLNAARPQETERFSAQGVRPGACADDYDSAGRSPVLRRELIRDHSHVVDGGRGDDLVG